MSVCKPDICTNARRLKIVYKLFLQMCTTTFALHVCVLTYAYALLCAHVRAHFNIYIYIKENLADHCADAN